MRLVEIDDISSSTCANYDNRIDDDSYSKPCVMSTLDNAMNEILLAPMPDGEKWKLYTQTLQRYLNHSKFNARKIDSNFSLPEKDNGSRNITFQPAENSFNLSLENFSPTQQFDMSGVDYLRDSLDSISQPAVRNFFEKARKVNSHVGVSSPSPAPILESEVQHEPVRQSQRSKKKPHKSTARRVQPYRSNAGEATRKRRAETSLSNNLSLIRPCKVAMHRLHWEPSTAI